MNCAINGLPAGAPVAATYFNSFAGDILAARFAPRQGHGSGRGRNPCNSKRAMARGLKIISQRTKKKWAVARPQIPDYRLITQD